MSTTYSAYHLAARATPALIGRTRPLEQIKQAVEEKGTAQVFYVHAQGGIGKTRLLSEVLDLCHSGAWKSADKPLLAVREPVDLYHFETHSLEGMLRALMAVLPEEAKGYFEAYKREQERLERVKPDLRFALREITDLRDKVVELFMEGFDQLTQEYRVVLAFDTAEMLLYETDAVQEALGVESEGIGIRPWLIERWLPRLSNAVVLVAGRPREHLQDDLQKHLGDRLCPLLLGPFTLDETRAYFEQVTQIARDAGEEALAQRIAAVPDETRQVIHLYTGGRPIMLALMIDLLAVADRLPQEVKVSLEQAQETAKSQETLERIRYNLESSVVNQFLRIGSLADEVIRVLAFARRGLSADMLARILDIPEDEARSVLGALAGLSLEDDGPPQQNGARPLSFIKVRPADRRVFLHDEMYDMMERHVLSKLPDPEVERIYREIIGWYGEQLAAIRERIFELEGQTRHEITLDRQIVTLPRQPVSLEVVKERADAESERNRLITKVVHYGLRQDPLGGFQAYCKYAEYAYEANDESLDMQLRDELLVFVNAPERKELAQIDGLRRVEVEADGGIRWVWRYSRPRRYYRRAIETAERMRDRCADLLREAGLLYQARLDIAQGYGYAYEGSDLARGEALLRRGIKALRDLDPQDAFHRWQKELELAKGYNGLGYVLRQRGLHRRSIAAYRRALPLWRGLGSEYRAEHANTLNNLSWALAELGEYEDAFRFCRDGLRLRQKEGARYPIALSYNTLGQIQTKAGRPYPARINCERALAIFRELATPRGIGMASIALSEAFRRLGETGEVTFPEEKAQLLWQAVRYAEDAVRIFGGDMSLPEEKRQPEVPERSRLVDALIEQGCAYREWARLRPSYDHRVDKEGEPIPETDPDRAELARRSEAALREATRVAGDKQPHRAVDALVNLAWLKYYLGDRETARQTIQQVHQAIPDDYHITEQRGLPEEEQDMPWYWVQLSKAIRLSGDLEFDLYLDRDGEAQQARARHDDQAEQYHREQAFEHLRKALAHYTLAEVYDELYGRGRLHRDQRRSEEQIYERLKSLNIAELEEARQAVQKTARRYKLGDRTRMAQLLENWFMGPEEVI